jgi:pyruvate formate-lyase activating enzyme-like uncharacterized protein
VDKQGSQVPDAHEYSIHDLYQNLRSKYFVLHHPAINVLQGSNRLALTQNLAVKRAFPACTGPTKVILQLNKRLFHPQWCTALYASKPCDQTAKIVRL